MRKFVFLALLAAIVLPVASAKADTNADKRMAQQIGSQLKQSGKLHNYTIGVKYHEGVAVIEGSVATPEQREAALRLAGECKGVKRVVNKLQCGGQAAQADSDRQGLTAALDRAAEDSAKSENGSGNTVTQAFGNSPNSARNPFKSQNVQASARVPSRRSNMPVPAGMMQPIRQASAVQQAGGGCPGGCAPQMGGPGMGGQGMGGPGMGGPGMGGPGMGGPGMMGPGMGGPCGPGMSGPGMGGPGMGPGMGGPGGMDAVPAGFSHHGAGNGPSYDNPQMPGYAWPSYASYPNYAALSYPKQYSPTAWPYIGPFYPYPQVPLAWRKVSLEWDDGWWFLDFSAHNSSH